MEQVNVTLNGACCHIESDIVCSVHIARSSNRASNKKINHRWTKIHGPNWTRTKCINKDYQRILCFCAHGRSFEQFGWRKNGCIKTGKWLQAKETIEKNEKKWIQSRSTISFTFYTTCAHIAWCSLRTLAFLITFRKHYSQLAKPSTRCEYDDFGVMHAADSNATNSIATKHLEFYCTKGSINHLVQ